MLSSLFLILAVGAVAQTPTPTQFRAKALAIYQPRPLYPSLADGRRPEGKGIFVFHVDPQTGRVRDVSVEKSTGFVILDQAAVDAFRQWRFKPGSRAKIKLPLTFTATGPDGRAQVSIP
jgi:TonB family protein